MSIPTRCIVITLSQEILKPALCGWPVVDCKGITHSVANEAITHNHVTAQHSIAHTATRSMALWDLASVFKLTLFAPIPSDSWEAYLGSLSQFFA
jgi:hypothetical protein